MQRLVGNRQEGRTLYPRRSIGSKSHPDHLDGVIEQSTWPSLFTEHSQPQNSTSGSMWTVTLPMLSLCKPTNSVYKRRRILDMRCAPHCRSIANKTSWCRIHNATTARSSGQFLPNSKTRTRTRTQAHVDLYKYPETYISIGGLLQVNLKKRWSRTELLSMLRCYRMDGLDWTQPLDRG